VVLPTPPEPATRIISRDASSASMRRVRRRRSRRPSRSRAPPSLVDGFDVDLGGERVAHQLHDPAAGGAREQLGHVQHVGAVGEPGAQPVEVAGSDPAARLGGAGRGHHGRHGSAGGVDEQVVGVVERSTTSACRRSNSAGSTRLATTVGSHAGLVGQPVERGRASR
jgi:hypothetical protein